MNKYELPSKRATLFSTSNGFTLMHPTSHKEVADCLGEAMAECVKLTETNTEVLSLFKKYIDLVKENQELKKDTSDLKAKIIEKLKL